MDAPRVVLIAIGDELLNGTTINTNAAWLAGALTREGACVPRILTVGDDPAGVVDAVLWAREHGDVVVCSGGLGPTDDDRTRDAIAAAFGVPLREDPETLAWLRRRFETGGRTMPASNRRQAMFPEGARVLANPIGSAPGFAVTDARGGAVFALPGVPVELRRLGEDHLLPWLRAEWASAMGARPHRVLRTTGVSESGLADRLESIEELVGVTIAYLPSTDGVDLHLRAADDAALERAVGLVEEEVGGAIYAVGERDLVTVVAAALRERGWRLALAESCTGGLLAQRITSFAGSSEYFLGGLVTYSNESKAALAGVEPALIAERGAVSAEVARALAAGARRSFGAEAGLAITGIAGPDGGSAEKPVGTVFIAARTPAADETRELHLTGDRAAVRERSAQAALELLRRTL